MTTGKILAFVLAVSCGVVSGHHGKDYLVTSSYRMPHKGELILILGGQFAPVGSQGEGAGHHHHQSEEEQSPVGFDPGVLFAAAEGWTVEAHAHQGYANGSIHTAALGIESTILILRETRNGNHGRNSRFDAPFSLAVLMEATNALGEFNNDLETRVIIGKEVAGWTFVANLITEKTLSSAGPFRYRYALGLSPWAGTGLHGIFEMDGSFGRGNEFSLIPGIGFSAGKKFDIRIGSRVKIKGVGSAFNVRGILVYEL
ncbi:MAG: hypothetical protein ACE5GH_04055 [Fidelibacterota bacterium]